MLLQDFCTALSQDSMKLPTPQRHSVDITRHGTLLYLTPEIVPYRPDMKEVEQQLGQYMSTLGIDMTKVPELPTGVDAVEQLKALMNALKPTYYHFITAGLPNSLMDSYWKGRTAFQLKTVPTRRYPSKAPPENTAAPKEEPEPTEAKSKPTGVT